ncbi:MAG: DNA recombination protein RmuC [Flavobacteriaceae bacterium]|nr:MAG: DNA recombination protein RmuC [Flavobacteriaceae bacterium]
MNHEILLIIIGCLGLIFGFIIGKLVSSNTLNKELISYKEQVKTFLREQASTKELIRSISFEKDNEATLKKQFEIECIIKNEELKNLQEKLENNKTEVKELQEKFTTHFELLANKILEEKSSKFTAQNHENIKSILVPLQEKIQHFEKKIEDTHKESIDYHASLRQQIIGLAALNTKMSNETLNLTRALKGDSKTQGNWGELILERVLEKSGLEKGREYELEKSFNVNDENKSRLRPDVIIHLPDNKKMIVDSKVSLTAYEQYVNAETEEEQSLHLKNHLISLHRHVNQLSAKKYETLYEIESPDFVLLFVPIEPAFAIAINADNQLYNKAFEKNIVIVTPSTLLATLRTIDSMWNNEKQQRNAIEIARQAGALYDKFEGLYQDLLNIGKKLDGAKADYDKAINKLSEGRGNLISSVQKLKNLGAKAKKTLPQNIVSQSTEDK